MLFDANILVHAVNEASELREDCQQRLGEARTVASSLYLTWDIAYEFLRVTTHSQVFPAPLSADRALRFLNELLDSPGARLLAPTDRHQQVLALTLAEFPDAHGVRSLYTAVVMRENNIDRICTLDRDFQRFPFLTVVDPRS